MSSVKPTKSWSTIESLEEYNIDGKVKIIHLYEQRGIHIYLIMYKIIQEFV